ncbi:hypothetical protein [Microbacterium sp. WCS2018Hpa-23]|uniref:hypothetical protein n=1 Tax=Microbacterium sp. WCS2018Hpa-23 TaxID=3073634 RepID=UPI0028831333|nr:hypothetical protein [Microbacterium sp. WCS2018Hpa-23]
MHGTSEPPAVGLDESVRRHSRASRLRTLGSIALIVSGILLGVVPLISNETSGGFWAGLLGDLLGFAVLLAGVVLISTGSALAGRIILIAGAAVALFGFTWFLHLGLVFQVPIWGWSAATALAFFCAGAAYAVERQAGFSLASLLLCAGSLWTGAIAFGSPIWAPPYTYLPTSVAAIVVGLGVWALNGRTYSAATEPAAMRSTSSTR